MVQHPITEVLSSSVPGRLTSLTVPASRPARAPRISGYSRCRRAPGGPSLGTAPGGAPESSRHTLPGRRRGSGGWTDVA